VRFDLDELVQAGERSEESEKALHKRIYGFMLDLYELRTFLAVNRTGGQKIVKKLSRLLEAPEARAEYSGIEHEFCVHLPDIVHELSIRTVENADADEWQMMTSADLEVRWHAGNAEQRQ
jgi:hypothetical protein